MKLAHAIVAAAYMVCCVTTAQAAELPPGTTYRGTISAVSIGFFNEVGIILPAGTTCAGQRALILQSSNPKYNEILSTMITAQINHAPVAIYQPASNQKTGAGFCTIGEASLGDNSYWP